jgi:hypothetical protein
VAAPDAAPDEAAPVIELELEAPPLEAVPEPDEPELPVLVVDCLQPPSITTVNAAPRTATCARIVRFSCEKGRGGVSKGMGSSHIRVPPGKPRDEPDAGIKPSGRPAENRDQNRILQGMPQFSASPDGAQFGGMGHG